MPSETRLRWFIEGRTVAERALAEPGEREGGVDSEPTRYRGAGLVGVSKLRERRGKIEYGRWALRERD